MGVTYRGGLKGVLLSEENGSGTVVFDLWQKSSPSVDCIPLISVVPYFWCRRHWLILVKMKGKHWKWLDTKKQYVCALSCYFSSLRLPQWRGRSQQICHFRSTPWESLNKVTAQCAVAGKYLLFLLTDQLKSLVETTTWRTQTATPQGQSAWGSDFLIIYCLSGAWKLNVLIVLLETADLPPISPFFRVGVISSSLAFPSITGLEKAIVDYFWLLF